MGWTPCRRRAVQAMWWPRARAVPRWKLPTRLPVRSSGHFPPARAAVSSTPSRRSAVQVGRGRGAGRASVESAHSTGVGGSSGGVLARGTCACRGRWKVPTRPWEGTRDVEWAVSTRDSHRPVSGGKCALDLEGVGAQGQRFCQASGAVRSCLHPSGQVARAQIGQRGVVEDLAQAGSHGDPQAGQVLRDPLVGRLVGTQASHLRERAVDGAEDVADADLARRPAEHVAAACSAPAQHEVVASQVGEDGLEELPRQLLTGRQGVDADRARSLRLRLREDQHCPDGVVHTGRDVHARSLPHGERHGSHP